MENSKFAPLLLLLLLTLTSSIAAFQGLPSFQSARGSNNLSVCMAEGASKSWEFSRFARTWQFFNGNPLRNLIPFLPSSAPKVKRPEAEASGREMCLWDFKDLTQESLDGIWAALDDVVMGGVSLSSIRLAESGVVFAGETSSRNSGGFCSVRAERTRNVDPPFNLEGYKSLRMKVRCDKGMRYKVILRDKAGWDTTAWCYSFDTQRGQVRGGRRRGGQDVTAVAVDGSGGSLGQVRSCRARAQVEGRKQWHGPLEDLLCEEEGGRKVKVQVMLSKYEYDGELNPNFEEGRFRLQFGPIRASKESLNSSSTALASPEATRSDRRGCNVGETGIVARAGEVLGG
eukprot:754255-Hanusia_phi.AAC.4